MRFALSIIIFALLGLPALADNKPPRSIVYKDRFVWVIAERFSDDLVAFQTKHGILKSDREKGEMGMQYSILYHHFMVKCDGPLPALAKLVGDAKREADADDAGQITAAYLSVLDDRSWAVLNEWRSKVLFPLLDTLASGDYKFFPKRITPGFLAQNEEIASQLQPDQVEECPKGSQ